jgi:hypothetical protein
MTKNSRRRRAAEFPLATVAAYGPDNTRATKLVVSILPRPDDPNPIMRTWTSEAGDVRTTEAIRADATVFIATHGVKRTVESDRIIGCQHEEGIDYPMGRRCPHCPFWTSIDRFTHEPITEPPPSLTPEEVLKALAEDDPDRIEGAIASADAHREALVERLLEALDRGIRDPQGASQEDASLFAYALYLVAKWRDTRAYPHVVRWLSLPQEEPFDIAGDIVTQDGARILAAVCDGNLEPIMSLIVNRQADEWGRGAGVTAIALLAAWGEVPRAKVIDRLRWLVREGLEREPGAVWEALAASSTDIEALELFSDVAQAFDDGLIDSQFMRRSELDKVEATPRGEIVRKTRERYPPIDDVVEATAWWDRRSDTVDDAGESFEVAEPYRAPPKVGRNQPCPCGSGRKYKKCCGA